MPYSHPMQYLQPYFTPSIQKALGMLPTFLAHKRGREQLTQRKEEFAVRKPYLETQTEIAREKMKEARRAKEDFLYLQQGGLPGFAEVLPEGMAPETFIRGRRAGIFGPVSLTQPKADKGFTLGPGQARYGPEGEEIAREKPKEVKPKAPTLKPMQNTQGQWTYHQFDPLSNQWVDTGKIAQAPTRPATTMDINKEISRLQTARSKILSQWNDFKATGLANDLVVLLTQGQLQPGQGVPPELTEALENQYIAHIKEVDTQLTEYYRQVGRTPQTFNVPSEKDNVAITIDKYKGGK